MNSQKKLKLSYWGDLDIGESIQTAKLTNPVVNNKVPQETAKVPEQSSEQALPKPKPQNSEAKVRDIKNHLMDKSSKAVTEDIIQIRNKYVVGKLAGDNLYDQQGTLIVAKNQVITSEIVDWADQEGKLSELIFNMIIPGLE